MFSSILESTRHKLLIIDGLTLMPPSLHGWEAFPTPGALTHTKTRVLRSFGPSHQRRHKSQVSIQGPPCAHGVSYTPHREVRDKQCHIHPIKWQHGPTNANPQISPPRIYIKTKTILHTKHSATQIPLPPPRRDIQTSPNLSHSRHQ